MNKNKNWISMLIMVCLVMILAACSENTDKTKQESADGEIIKLNIAHGNQPNEPLGQLAEKWKELAEEKSGGKLELTIYPSSQLGAEKDVVEQALMGNNVIIFTGYDFLMDYVPDVGILTAPYLTENFDELLSLTTTEWFADLESELNDKGIEIINTNTIYGVRHLMTSKPVTSPEDLKGMKIRVPNNQMYIKTFKALGASPTPMPLGDLYTSLQQGLIDGAENPLPVLEGAKVNEVVHNLTLTEHTKIMSPWIAGTEFIETLPDETVKILKKAGIEAAEYARDIIEGEEESVLAMFEEQGINIIEVDLEPFKESAISVYTDFPEWSDGLYETVKGLLEEE